MVYTFRTIGSQEVAPDALERDVNHVPGLMCKGCVWTVPMDVHAASCTLAVISDKGRKLRDFVVETNGQVLVEAIRMIPGHKHLV